MTPDRPLHPSVSPVSRFSRRCALVVLAVLLGTAALVSPRASTTQDAPPDPPPYSLEEITNGVWLARRPELYTFADSNSVVVETDAGLLVVDAQADPDHARWLAHELRRRFDQPVRWLVASHWHGDHTQGLGVYRQTFGDDLPLLAHDTWWEDVQKRGLPQLEAELGATRRAVDRAAAELARGRGLQGEELDAAGREALDARLERSRRRVERLAAVEIPHPTATFSDRLVLHQRFRGEPRPIHLLHFRAHTRGDLVLHLPAAGVVITGDLLDVLPFGGHGYPESWIAALDRLEALGYRWALPGHGPAQEGVEHLGRVRAMLRFVRQRAAAAVQAGDEMEKAREAMMSAEELETHRQALAGDDPRRNRAFDQFLPDTFDRAFEEAAGFLAED